MSLIHAPSATRWIYCFLIVSPWRLRGVNQLRHYAPIRGAVDLATGCIINSGTPSRRIPDAPQYLPAAEQVVDFGGEHLQRDRAVVARLLQRSDAAISVQRPGTQ